MRILFIMIVLSLIAPCAIWAMPEYSSRTGQGCKACHLEPGGGALSPTGLQFAASGYTWPPSGGYRVIGSMRKWVRVLVGYVHVLGSFIWFGTILYVHIVLRPGYASRGLPKGEVMLGLGSMAAVGISGLLLTISRVRGMDVLYKSPWGMILSAKIALYVFMVLTALVVVIFIGPRLRRGQQKAVMPADGVFDPSTLAGFDGKEGRPAYVALRGGVYDVTLLKLWKGGMHMKHSSGGDMTDAIGRAPHGVEKLDGVPRVGLYEATHIPRKTAPQRAFYFVAYMNLALVFVFLFLIALWRWGI